MLLATVSLGAADTGDFDPEGLLPRAMRDDTVTRQLVEALASSGPEKALELARLQARPWDSFWTGYLHLRLGDAIAAVHQLRRAEAQGLSRESAKLLAAAYYAAHQYKLFLHKIRQAMETDPDDASPHYYLGRYYESDLRDFAKAEECFREALKRNDRHIPSYYHLGYAAEARGDWDTATKHYRTAADLAQKSGRRYGLPWQGLARIELQSGRPKEALPLARRAIDLGAADVETQRIFARICSALELSSEAIRAWERVAELDTTDPAPHYQLFRLRQKLGQTEQAKASLSRYQALEALYGGS